MTTSHACLTPNTLLRDFGPRTAVTCDGVRVLYEAVASAPRETLSRWRIHFAQWAGRAVEKAPKCLAKLAKRLGVAPNTGDPDTLLLAMQTYYAILVEQVADRVLPNGPSQLDGGELLPGSPFSWYKTVASEPIQQVVDRICRTLADYDLAAATTTDDDGGDLFKPLYQELFPRSLRHALGEYYTPDWLARHVLDQVGYLGTPDQRLLDPSCGSGSFLMMAIRRMRAPKSPFAPRKQRHFRGAKGDTPEFETPFCDRAGGSASIHHSPFPIVGFDLNPLAVLTARANYLVAIADLLPETGQVELPVYLCDSIIGDSLPPCAAAQFDFVVGNPPWIAWDNLSDADRQATKPLWEHYGLFSLSGNAARHGGGKKDLSMLMLYATADRHLKPGGRLGMVITQTIFQSKGAGDGFRRFRLGPDGVPLRVLRVDDMTELRPFDAANWTSTIVLQKGEPTEYPVKYVRWKSEDAKCGNATEDRCVARPIDPARPNSPWLVLPDTKTSACSFAVPHCQPQSLQSSSTNDSPSSAADPSSFIIHPSHYTAHLGANSGGANGVYWIELLDQADDGVRIRNMTGKGKLLVDSVEHTVEPDLLYPLLRWSDVRRWSAVPHAHILLSQEPTSRRGIAEETMRKQYPRTLAYLEQFRSLLTTRAAYRRYQESGPFYSMYNVGPYTVAPIKVVWRRMDRQINAAVIETIHDPRLGCRPIVPQETCVIVACSSADEAYYVCAMLNSQIVGELVSASSVRGGKGFGTPGMLDFIPMTEYRPDDPRHVELAALSRTAHSIDSPNIQGDIDRLAAQVLSGCSTGSFPGQAAITNSGSE